MYRAFTLTWRTSVQIYWNKKAFTLEKSSPHTVFVWNTNMAAVTSFENVLLNVSPRVLISFFSSRVRTKFAVVDDDFGGQTGRTRVRAKKLGPSSQKADHGKEWKPSKSEIRRQNFDTSTVNNNSYQMEGTGQITPLPPPLVSLRCFFLCIPHLCADSCSMSFLLVIVWEERLLSGVLSG